MGYYTTVEEVNGFTLEEVLKHANNGNGADTKVVNTYKKGEFVFFPNEDSDKIFFLEKGRVKIGCYSDNGKEIIKAVLYPGEIFGELGLVGKDKRTDFAQAMDHDVVVAERTVEDTRRLMRDHRQFNMHILEMLGKKLIGTEERLESLIFKDARTRIVDFLKNLANKYGQRVGVEMLVKDFFTHQEIANLTGTSRQTVTTVLNELRDDNMIYFDRKRLLIRDMEALA